MGKLLDMFQGAGLTVQDLRGKLSINPQIPWGVRELDQIQGMVVHHTAWDGIATPEGLAYWHVEKRGFPGIAYTFYLPQYQLDGARWTFCHKLREIGWHAKGVNSYTFGIALGGRYIDKEPPMWMIESTALLIDVLKGFFEEETGEGLWVNPHYAVSLTECPGKVWEAYTRYRVEE